jgi:hypothetical protein
MGRRSQNLVTMAVLMEQCAADFSRTAPASGSVLRLEGELAALDKPRARLPGVRRCAINIPMKAIVPCLVLGSSVVSAAVLLVASVLLFGN